MDPIWALMRKGLFRLDAETAHGLSIAGMKTGLAPKCSPAADPRIATQLAGLTFANPLGLAAGYDKNAEVPMAMLALGFGFVEVGTITPKPQDGNPKPRVFRLVEDEAVINRLGFNNQGHAAALTRIAALPKDAMVGVNIGANKDATDRIADYVAGIDAFAAHARYFTANISSPNTPGLRDLQGRASLAALLSAVLAARDAAALRHGRRVPVFLKIAPDLDDASLDDIAAEALDKALDGLIISNTTLSRAGLLDVKTAKETGGLSGKPLFAKATMVLAKMRKRVGPDLPIIGVGGVHDAESAAEKIRAGADLVQIYSSLVYGGPRLPAQIIAGLSALCDRDRLSSLRDIRDSRVDHWASVNA